MSRFGRLSLRVFVALVLCWILPLAAVAQDDATLESTPGAWSFVLLPDMQNYNDSFPGMFTLQTHWIARNRDKFNIQYVLTLGDFTNGNTDREWQNAKEAMEELDGKVPYVLVSGNHDYTPLGNSASGASGLNQCLPASKYVNWPTFGGTRKPDDITSSYHLFSAGGIDWIIVALEWAPNDEAVQWANDILAKYPERKAILVTHSYLYGDDARHDFAAHGDSQKCNPHAYARDGQSVNDGEELWQKLVRKNNFALVFCGHLCNGGAGLLTSENDRGKKVHQILTDYQGRKLGGEGLLRVVKFLPDGKTVQVTTFSPFYNKCLCEPEHHFCFELDR